MTSWTPSRSILLSQLLDDVVGTEEMVRIRQDYCRIKDCIRSNAFNINSYFTGSKAEGLNLPGSDLDFMHDINNLHDMQVIQTKLDARDATQRNLFVMSTENVRPCFVMLRSVSPIDDRDLLNACQDMNNFLYLSSYLYVHNATTDLRESFPHLTITRQGPSTEGWSPYMDRSQSGTDAVCSIHCSFWPDAARQWQSRTRESPWPSPLDIKTIVDFGFHLVPVGHPQSDTNMMEWRISFSVAERTLVWSFNNIQMQCYAVMKLILKEFINPHCSLPSCVLCSYFIKTFLFWKYEETDISFWCKENLRECVMVLLSDFRECVRVRSLRHYFIPSFNLLSVKMTYQAQQELLRIFDTILQSDISIIKECKTLNKTWVECLNNGISTIDVAETVKRNLLKNDICMMDAIGEIQYEVLKLHRRNHNCAGLFTLTSQFIYHFRMQHTVYKTYLPLFAMRILLHYSSISLTYIQLQRDGNKIFYTPRRFLQSNVSGIDISTCRMWYAMIMTKCGDYCLSLDIINKVLSSVSPFAIYSTGRGLRRVSDETKSRYVDMFISNGRRATERARRAWMLDSRIMPLHMDIVPAAIQVELKHCDGNQGILLSPFVCAYYLMFMNYCGLGQNDARNRALRQLIDVVIDPEQCGENIHTSYNIAGHCLLTVGETEQARNMFIRSYEFTMPNPPFHRHNSAQYYLQFLLQNATNN